MREWLSAKLRNGFWFPVFLALVRRMYETCSLGYRFKRWLRTASETPRGASELYQCVWLLLALLWLALIRQPVHALTSPSVQLIASVVAGYRIIEILLFSLHWVFVASEETLHSIRRSLAGFIFLICEVALYSSIILLLTQCTVGGLSQWQVAYANISAAFGLSLPETMERLACRSVAHAQLIVSAILLSIAVASLVGGVLRPEKERGSGAA